MIDQAIDVGRFVRTQTSSSVDRAPRNQPPEGDTKLRRHPASRPPMIRSGIEVPTGNLRVKGSRMARMVQCHLDPSLDMLVRQSYERSDEAQLEIAATNLIESLGWRTALVVAERTGTLTLDGDWEAAKAWRHFFEIVFAQMATRAPANKDVLGRAAGGPPISFADQSRRARRRRVWRRPESWEVQGHWVIDCPHARLPAAISRWIRPVIPPLARPAACLEAYPDHTHGFGFSMTPFDCGPNNGRRTFFTTGLTANLG